MKRAMKEKLGWSRPLILSRVRRARFLMALNLVVEWREKEEGGMISQLRASLQMALVTKPATIAPPGEESSSAYKHSTHSAVALLNTLPPLRSYHSLASPKPALTFRCARPGPWPPWSCGRGGRCTCF